MTERRLKLGAWGEDQAVLYLRQKGAKILHRNYRTPVGEIDIIARYKKLLLFIEVKTRRSAVCGVPAEAVGPVKQRQIVRTALWFLQKEKLANLQPRFDVISILGDGENVMALELIENAFGA
ncbi:MAG: YraN family protein [Desulfuromonadales bacterium]|nr:YraN family protein [Desulfuromonadales bacterium]